MLFSVFRGCWSGFRMVRWLIQGIMPPRLLGLRSEDIFWGLSSENINFDFEDKDKLGLESTQTPRGLK